MLKLGANITVLELLEPLEQAEGSLLVRPIGCILQYCTKTSKIPVLAKEKAV